MLIRETIARRAFRRTGDGDDRPRDTGGRFTPTATATEAEVRAQIADLARQAKDMERERDAERAAHEAERSQGRRLAADEALRKAGVTNPHRRRAALAILETSGYLAAGDDGAPVFRGPVHGMNCEMGLEAGLRAWLRSDGATWLEGERGGTAEVPGEISDREAGLALCRLMGGGAVTVDGSPDAEAGKPMTDRQAGIQLARLFGTGFGDG
jgi:hypothetical protein